jgi:hypothetical protein
MAAIAVAVVFVPSALAVHDLSFQLDGDVSTHRYTTVDASQVYDWGGNTAGDTSTQANPNTNGLFTVTDTGTAPTGTEAVTNNSTLVGDGKPFGAAGFVRDFRSGSSCTLNSLSATFCTSDTSTYATGSKDTLGIGNGGWQCNKDNNVNSKIDIMNAYAASFVGGGASNDDHNIYFGLEKNKDNGTNDVGVWLLQGTASCDKITGGGGQNFSGAHQNKDVLVVSEFSNGGGVSTIKAFQWAANAQFPGDKGCIDSNDWPDPNSNAPGVVPAQKGCNGLPISTSNSDCKITGGTDSLCATTNAKCADATKACGKSWNDTIATPWLTSDATLGVGRDQIVSPDFYEGGIDLTKVFQGAGETAPSCFNTVVPDTRSSATITATLFDFVAAQLGECHSSTVTHPVDATDHSLSPAGSIPADPNDSAVTVQDKATVHVTGISSFSGSIHWFICGTLSSGTCDSGGVDLGSTDANASGDYFSPVTTITAAGRYCFRAEFSSTTTGVPPSSDHSAGECFTVAPVTPTISTQAGAGPVDFGSSVTDTATLTGTAHKPGTGGPTGATPAGSINPTTPGGDATGNITFTLYKDDCSTLATGTGTNPQTVAITGDGQYGPVSFTPDAPGTYYWSASYPGQSPNTNQATDNSPCPSASEAVVVRTIGTDIKTKQSWIPNDTATVSAEAGNLAAGGSVAFSLYDNSTCSGAALYSETVSVAGGASSREVSTSNAGSASGGFTITSGYDDAAGSIAGPYSWKVTYTPGAADTAHKGSQSTCDAEHFGITYTNDPGPGTDLP